MMTDDEIIAVVQAHKEGKKIQCKRRSKCDPLQYWDWADEPIFDFNTYDYRVALEPRKPREWKVGLTPNGEIIQGNPAYYFEGPILVREVIE